MLGIGRFDFRVLAATMIIARQHAPYVGVREQNMHLSVMGDNEHIVAARSVPALHTRADTVRGRPGGMKHRFTIAPWSG